MKIDRTKNAGRNIVFGCMLKIYQIVMPFIMRTLMIYYMGIQYLGLNSLFTSILQVLNLAGQGQPRILKELREHGIMNQKELADACLMDVTTMSRTLDRMEKDGLLKRENNPASRRSWNVLLTDCGHEKADEVIKIFNKVDDVIFKGFSEEEIKMLSSMWRDMAVKYAEYLLK